MLLLFFTCLMTPVLCSPLPSLLSNVSAALFRSSDDSNSWLNMHWSFTGGIATGFVTVVDREPQLSFDARPGAFGAELADPMLGYLIPLSSFTYPCEHDQLLQSRGKMPRGDNLGCPRLCISPELEYNPLSKAGAPDPTESWVALVQRGSCEFAEKVREAQRLGARGVVVGNVKTDATLDGLVSMYSPDDSSDISIPSTFVSYESYSHLLDLIGKSNTTKSGIQTISVLLSAEYSGAWEWYSPLLTFMSILLLPTLITLATLLIHRLRVSRAEARQRCPEEIILKLAWSKWPAGGLGAAGHLEKRFDEPPTVTEPEETTPVSSSVDGRAVSIHSRCEDLLEAEPQASTSALPIPWFNTQSECAICLSEFIEGDIIRILPCHHIFHLKEVDEWLVKVRKVCPICKYDVTLPFIEPEQAADSNSSEPSASADDDTEETGQAGADEETPLLGWWRGGRR